MERVFSSTLPLWETVLGTRTVQARSERVWRLINNEDLVMNWQTVMERIRNCCGHAAAAPACVLWFVLGKSTMQCYILTYVLFGKFNIVYCPCLKFLVKSKFQIPAGPSQTLWKNILVYCTPWKIVVLQSNYLKLLYKVYIPLFLLAVQWQLKYV